MFVRAWNGQHPVEKDGGAKTWEGTFLKITFFPPEVRWQSYESLYIEFQKGSPPMADLPKVWDIPVQLFGCSVSIQLRDPVPPALLGTFQPCILCFYPSSIPLVSPEIRGKFNCTEIFTWESGSSQNSNHTWNNLGAPARGVSGNAKRLLFPFMSAVPSQLRTSL